MISVSFRFFFFIFFSFIVVCNTISLQAQVFWDGNSYKSEDKIAIDTIVFVGNKVTKNKIILRELIFHTGDTLKQDALQECAHRSHENLMNTSLFNFVEIHLITIADKTVNVTILFKERWYIFPMPLLEIADRNFNEWWLTKDLSRLNYGLYVNWNNFRGRKEVLKFTIQGGYSQKFNINYQIPYIDKRQKTGISVYGGYNRNHEIAYTLDESKLVFFKDEFAFVRKEIYGGLRLNNRYDIYTNFSFFGEYRYSQIEDTVVALNSDYFINEANYQQMIIPGFNYRFDDRDLQIYATHGSYFEYEVGLVGLGILKNEPSLIYMMANYRKYLPLASRWNYNFSIKGRLNSLEPAPYYNQRALGYGNDFVRGYEYYVINGQSYGLFKNAIRYNLVKPAKFSIEAVPAEKFNTIPYAVYIDAFLDIGYVKDDRFPQTNPLANTFIPGAGLGIDLVTYYNIVARVEYSINKYGEQGFFIHMGSAF